MNIRGLNRGLFHFVLLGAMSMAIGGCGQAYRANVGSVTKPYSLGQFSEASANAARAAKEGAERDKLVLLLEEGSTSRAAGQFAQSSQALDQADEMFAKFDTEAKVSASQETAGVLVSPAAMTYKGYGYDRIMTNVDKALNYMELGKGEEIRTEITRIAAAQQACQVRYENEIAEAKKQQDSNKDVKSDFKEVRKDPKYQSGEAAVFADYQDDKELNGQTPIENISYAAVYSNPFATYLTGLFYLYSGAPGEAERARVSFREVAGMIQTNSYIAKDVAEAEKAANFTHIAPKTYVFFETGLAPERREIRIDLPIFLVNIAVKDTKVDYVGVAFPKLHKNGDYFDALNISTAGGTFRTEVLADMDKIVAREFKHELPIIITRLVISAGIKAAANYAAAKATENQSIYAQIAARGATVLYGAATNEADLRSWRTLPKQIQIANFPTPPDGVVTISYTNGVSAGVVNVAPGKSNIIWIRSASREAPAAVRSFAVN